MLFVIEGRFEVESCFVIIIIIIFMPPPLLKHSSHPQCGSPLVWCEATHVVTGAIANTVVVVTTVVASCPAGADRTAAIAGGKNSAPRQATPPSGDGDLGDLGKQRRPQASNEWGMVGSSKGWWVSADGWRDEAGETRWGSADGWPSDEDGWQYNARPEYKAKKAEHKKTATRGGGDHAASQRNEFDDVVTEFKNMKEDIMKGMEVMKETMKGMEENLQLAKEEIRVANSRIEMLEFLAKGIPAVVTGMGSPAPAVRAPQSPVVTALGSAPVVGAPLSPALTAPQSEADDEPCRWHKYKPESVVDPDYEGIVEKDADVWIHHLGSTLFAENSRTLYKILERIRPVMMRDKCRVTACRTKANRFFHVQCLKCLQCVYGRYGTWTEDASPMAPKRAMSLLAEFFMIEEGGEKPQT